MPKRSKIGPRERTFCLLYAKSWKGAESYREAYPQRESKYAKIYAHKLLQRPDIQELIKKNVEEALGPLEKDLSENVKFWIDMRDNPEEKPSNRLKASEYLAKYRGLFTEKSEVNMKSAVTIVDDL